MVLHLILRRKISALIYQIGALVIFLIAYKIRKNINSFFGPERKLYDIDLQTKAVHEVEIEFSKKEVYSHATGYGKESQWLQYCCKEDVFNSIVDELAGSIHGHAFDKQKQIQEYLQVNASPDGDCGEKVYQYIIKNRD